MTRILHIDASMRHEGSVSRALSAQVVEKFSQSGGAEVIRRDLADGLPFIDAAWIGANFTDPAERTEDQKAVLGLSDDLVAEMKAADVIVLGVPLYNFGVPAALKAWIDLVSRARETFRYTENGPEGLLKGKRAVLAIASGGTEVGSAIDFVAPYLRHVLGFLGITDVEIVAADRQMADAEAARAKAEREIAALAA